MSATIRDVKEKTGLSLATISKYLNGGNVLPENKILIEKAIRELNYEVNEIARGLVKNKTKTVGVIAYDISSFFTSNMLHHIGLELRKRGYAMLICDSCNDEKIEADNVRFLLNRKVDGIIVIPVSMSGRFLEPTKKADIPVVLLDRSFQDDSYDSVCIDNRVAACRAVDILIKKHHKKIAIIGSDKEDTGIERFKGYKEAMEHAGLELCQEYMHLDRFSVEFGYRQMKQLLAMDDRPTAVFLSNYETALGGVMAVNESSLFCPEDISVFAFDDLLISNVLRPKLWLIRQPMEQMCHDAVTLLLKKIAKESVAETVKMSFRAKIQEGDSIRDLG